MGKAAMCIKMLQILNTGRVYKVSELASLLDTNPRNVKKYKKLPLIAWCITSQSEYMKVIKYCDNIIFENFEPRI